VSHKYSLLLVAVVSIIAVASSPVLGGHGLGPPISDELEGEVYVTSVYTLTFEVLDEGNDPIEGAEVVVDGVGSDTTDANGEVVFEDLAPDTYDYTVSKDAYESVSDTVEIVDEDVTETVTLEQEPEPDPPTPAPTPVVRYDLTIEVDGEGATDPEAGTHTYSPDSDVTIEAIPADDWLFHQWLIDDEVSEVEEPELTITMDDDKDVTAVFVRSPVVLPYVGEIIDPNTGGALAVPDLIELLIPPLAAPNEFEIGVTAQEADPEVVCAPDGPVDGVVFEVTAFEWVDDEQEPLDAFQENVDVTLHWEEDLDRDEAESILIHYYHEGLQMWIPLPTEVDVVNQRAVAEIDGPVDLVMCIKDKFTDIHGHWSERYILLLSEYGAISGYPDMTFRPDTTVNREEFTRMLVDAAGIEVPEIVRLLPVLVDDSDEISTWAQPYVEAALSHGLIEGFEDGTFRPSERVTRAQVATMLSRALGLSPQGDLPFTDAEEIPGWAGGHVAALANLDIIRGYPVNEAYYFRPDEVTTRAEAAAFLTRYLEARLE